MKCNLCGRVFQIAVLKEGFRLFNAAKTARVSAPYEKEKSVAGLSVEQAQETVTALMSIPVVTIASASFSVEGEEGSGQILEEDVITCSLSLLLKRPSHQKPGVCSDKDCACSAEPQRSEDAEH